MKLKKKKDLSAIKVRLRYGGVVSMQSATVDISFADIILVIYANVWHATEYNKLLA